MDVKKWFTENKKVLSIFFLFFIIFYILQFRVPEIIGYDGYMHIKIAELTKEGIIKEFPWTTESILKDNYSDHQFLYRILLIPFTFFGLMFLFILLTVISNLLPYKSPIFIGLSEL